MASIGHIYDHRDGMVDIMTITPYFAELLQFYAELRPTFYKYQQFYDTRLDPKLR